MTMQTRQVVNRIRSVKMLSDTTSINKNIILTLSVILVSLQLASFVASFHLPYEMMRSPSVSGFHESPNRRQDDDVVSDYDDITPKASESQHNNDDNNGDGYGETDNDGPYEETPRDQEGQADLERFFDDHLGASDKDGMDKENLPTNVVATIADREPQSQTTEVQSTIPIRTVDPTIRQNEMLSYLKRRRSLLGAEKADIQEEPYKTKLIIMRQMEDDGLTRRANVTIGHFPVNSIASSQFQPESRGEGRPGSGYQRATNSELNLHPMPTIEPNRIAREASDKVSDRVRASEDDEMDKVYVTNRTDRPFKIDALGGYDPEEDFENATQDLEMQPREGDSGVESRPTRSTSEGTSEGDSDDSNGDTNGQSRESTNFNDPEVEALFNDASETDETFASDEPDWNDDRLDGLEVGAQSTNDAPSNLQGSSIPAGNDDSDNDSDDTDDGDQQHRPAASVRSHGARVLHSDADDDVGTTRRRADNDDDTSWVNDGVDDMEIPSKLDQERAIQKAVRHDAALARQRELDEEREASANDRSVARPSNRRLLEDQADDEDDKDEASADEHGQSKRNLGRQEGEDPTDVRMPNADYLKDDMRDLEEETNLKK